MSDAEPQEGEESNSESGSSSGQREAQGAERKGGGGSGGGRGGKSGKAGGACAPKTPDREPHYLPPAADVPCRWQPPAPAKPRHSLSSITYSHSRDVRMVDPPTSAAEAAEDAGSGAEEATDMNGSATSHT